MDKLNLKSFISYWQIAADGIWEEAKGLSIGHKSDEMQTILKWIDSVGDDIAIEAFFGNKFSDEFGFFGLRLSSLPKQKQKSFVQSLVGSISSSDDFKSFSSKLESLLKSFVPDGGEVKLFDQTPDFLELGAEGFWKSYGSYVVWRKGAGGPKSIVDIERNAPQLLKPFKRAIMLEHAWENPMPMWLAIPVSSKIDGEFVFDEKKYKALLGPMHGDF